ncbi:cytochrome c [Bradyrhizobium sp. BRP22]|uniref:c-type cytochrome n=1 Tax=Bradyrhizobium sp. BRP22 TaxID=2793821 RepID=UPI001CD67A25|nr:cytochrome c [Bradyrhizobium sp. BRP22]MCA1454332.1 cytochrome c [Bradyrhizobium sp. BRP22]
MKATRVLAGAALVLACSAPALAADGAKVYAETCQACHQAGGVGSPGLAQPLVSSVIANAASRQKDYPAMVVIHGMSGSLSLSGGDVIASAMPPQQGLNDDEIAAVVSYVYRLNRMKASVKPADVAGVRAQSAGGDELKRIRSGLMP